jgi:hypothetical protein
VRPGRVWYLAALAVLLAGAAWIVAGLSSVSRQVDAFPRVPLPAGGTRTVGRAGGYVVYYEGPGARSGQIPRIHVRIAPAAVRGPSTKTARSEGLGRGAEDW